MPRSAAWTNRSCAMVRPDTSTVVCARCSAVKVRGTSSNQCLLASTGRPRRLRSSISNCFSCSSIASSDIGSRLLSGLSFVVLIGLSLVLVLLGASFCEVGGGAGASPAFFDDVQSRDLLGLGALSLFFGLPLGGELFERLHFRIELVIGAADAGELRLQGLHQLEFLERQRAIELALLLRLIFELLAQQHQRVRVGLDADLDRAARLVRVDVVQRGVRLAGARDDGIDQAVRRRVVAALE